MNLGQLIPPSLPWTWSALAAARPRANAVPPAAPLVVRTVSRAEPPETDLLRRTGRMNNGAAILALVRRNGSISVKDVVSELGVGRHLACEHLLRLHRTGRLKRAGTRRLYVYSAPK